MAVEKSENSPRHPENYSLFESFHKILQSSETQKTTRYAVGVFGFIGALMILQPGPIIPSLIFSAAGGAFFSFGFHIVNPTLLKILKGGYKDNAFLTFLSLVAVIGVIAGSIMLLPITKTSVLFYSVLISVQSLMAGAVVYEAGDLIKDIFVRK